MPREVEFTNVLGKTIANLKAVHVPVRSGIGSFHCYVSLRKTAEGQAKQAIFSVMGADHYVKLVVVVDDDIDIFDEEQVLWAIATRMQANRDVFIVDGAMGTLLDPSATDAITAKMGIDATRPLGEFAATLSIEPGPWSGRGNSWASWPDRRMESFRTFLEDLRNAGELVDVHKPVDVRHVAALVDQSSTALLFHRVRGYDLPLVSGLLNDRKRIALSAGCDYAQMEQRLRDALDHPWIRWRQAILPPSAASTPRFPMTSPGSVSAGSPVPIADELSLGAYVGGGVVDEEIADAKPIHGAAHLERTAARIRELLAVRPMYFSEIAQSVPGVEFRLIARTMGELHAGRQIDAGP